MKKSLRGSGANAAELLKELRERAGLSRAKLAELAGYGRGTSLARYESAEYMGARRLPVDLVARLESALCGKGQPPISKEQIWALADTGSAIAVVAVATVSVPVVPWTQIQGGVGMLNKLKAEEHVQLIKLPAGNYLAARIVDDHCETEAAIGAYAVLDLDDREPRAGKIFAVIIEGRLVLRRYAPNPERWESLAARPEAAVYPTKTLTIVGRLVRVSKDYA